VFPVHVKLFEKMATVGNKPNEVSSEEEICSDADVYRFCILGKLPYN
jgi:hypothetical protein